MPDIKMLLLLSAAFIIITLVCVAIYYQNKVNKAQQEQHAEDQAEHALAQKNLAQRNQNIINDVRFIARAMLSEQCEITEGVLRMHHLCNALDAQIMLLLSFSAIHQHFLDCQDLPIKEAYKALDKKARFRCDNLRWTLEAKNKKAILDNTAALLDYEFKGLQPLFHSAD